VWNTDSIYSAGPIVPVVKIKENISVWTRSQWEHYRVEFIEPMPRSSPLMIEAVTLAGGTALAAGATINKRVVAALQLNEGEFLHLRWEPLDNVEGVLWEQSGQGRFNTRQIMARVDLTTRLYDPYLATSTFWILGKDRDINLEVRNPMTGYPTPTARFQFWGYRYILTQHMIPDTDKAAAQRGDLDTVRRNVGATTWLPAEGRAG